MGWFVIVEKYHNICAGSGDTLQNFVKYGNSQHKVTKTSLLTPTVCQQPMQKVIFVPKFATRVTIFQKTPVSFIGYIPHFEAFIVPVNLHLMPCVWGKLRAPGAHSTKNGILTPLFNK